MSAGRALRRRRKRRGRPKPSAFGARMRECADAYDRALASRSTLDPLVLQPFEDLRDRMRAAVDELEAELAKAAVVKEKAWRDLGR